MASPIPRRAPRRAALAAALALICGPLAAQSPAPPPAAATCGEHVVAPGETLGAIGRRHLAAGGAAAIFELNRDRLTDPDRIRAGQSLRLPCAPGASAPAVRPAPAGALEADPADGAPGGLGPDAVGPAPSSGEDAAEGAARGPEARVAEALAAGGGAPEAARLLAFPLVRPDCARVERLDLAAASLCARMAFSAPLGAVRMVWIVRAGSPEAEARAPAELRGKRICRPAGGRDADLAAAGLAPPRAARLAPEDAAACLAAVAMGEADAASLEAGQVRAALAARGPGAPGAALTEARALAFERTLHAAAPRGAPEARAALAALEAGLARLRAAAEEGEAR